MKVKVRDAAICGLAVAMCVAGWAQPKPQPKMPKTPVQLKLTAEVATTTDDGYPSSLLVTVTNVGNVTVNMPVLGTSCPTTDGGEEVQIRWKPQSPNGKKWSRGSACGTADLPPLEERIKDGWVRLRSGESMTITEPIDRDVLHNGPGTVTYWAVYTPPDASAVEVQKLMQEGIYILTEKLETPHKSFAVY